MQVFKRKKPPPSQPVELSPDQILLTFTIEADDPIDGRIAWVGTELCEEKSIDALEEAATKLLTRGMAETVDE